MKNAFDKAVAFVAAHPKTALIVLAIAILIAVFH